jgi:hypothetical protein
MKSQTFQIQSSHLLCRNTSTWRDPPELGEAFEIVAETTSVFEKSSNLPWQVCTDPWCFIRYFDVSLRHRLIDRRLRESNHVPIASCAVEDVPIAAPTLVRRNHECFRRMRQAIKRLADRSWRRYSRRRRRLAMLALRMIGWGWSLRVIQDIVGIARSTLSGWVRKMRVQTA